MSLPYVARPAGSTRPTSSRAVQQFAELQEDYEDRRNAGRVRYDEGLIGRSDYLQEPSPIDEDPNFRREVFSEMSHALRQNLNETRKAPAQERIYVERSQRSAASPPSPPPFVQRPLRQPRYDEDPDDVYDEDEEYDPDEYEPNPRPRRRMVQPRDPWEDLEPRADDDYDEDDESDAGYDYPDSREPAYQRRSQSPVRRTQTPARQTPSRRNAPVQGRSRRSEAYDDEMERSPRRRSPEPNARGYPDERRDRRPAPVRAYPEEDRGRDGYPRERVPARPPQQRVSYPQPVRGQPRTGVRPSRPQFLGPDGRIPTNPCGQPLYVDIGHGPLAVECQEERRGEAPPWHHGMPHIARIGDPRMNAENACFVWYYNEEAPR